MPLAFVSKVLENRVLRYIVYGTTFAVASEIGYQSFVYLYRQIVDRNNEILDVIWTNELTNSCINENCCGEEKEKRNDRKKEQYILGFIKSPSNGYTKKCSNRFCANSNIGRLIHYIDQAKYSIDLAMYTFTSHDLSSAFIRALRRGISIRIISDKEMVQSSGSQVLALSKHGVTVLWPKGTMLMHHKFCIIDGKKRVEELVKMNRLRKADPQPVRSLLMSGSLNWTMQGFSGNWENISVTSNKKFVAQYEEEFIRLWKVFLKMSAASFNKSN